MLIGSLFSGIGGLELGMERAGLGSVAWQVEQSAYCRHVLAKHWPEAERFDDVRTVGAHNLARVDVLCGGFPCQDLSAAGKGAGLEGARSGLWFEMRRIIDELRPGWVVVENVAHTWRRYVPVLRRALWDLGYASLPVRVRACDVGARHERARIFVVAHADGHLLRQLAERAASGRVDVQGGREAEPCADVADVDGYGRAAAVERKRSGIDRPWRRDADRGCVVADSPRDGRGEGRPGGLCDETGRPEHPDGAAPDDARLGLAIWVDLDSDGGEQRATAGGGADDRGGLVSPGFGLPPRPWMVRGVHGLPGWVDGARRSGWTPTRIRTARIHGLGNAVVPPCAEVVGRLIVSTLTPTEAP